MEAMALILNLLLKVYIVSVMFAMGLQLSLPHIKKELTNTGFVVRALLANIIIVPILSMVVIQLVPLSQEMVIALVLVASAPGYAPILSEMAGGNLARTAALMFLMAAVSLVTTPAVATLMFAGQASISINPLTVIITLLLFQILPLAAGLVLRSQRLELAQQLQKVFGFIARIAILIVMVAFLLLEFRYIVRTPWSSLLSIFVISTGGLAAGYLLGGPATADRKTLALNTKIRNLGLALLIAGSEFEGQHVEREIIVYGLIMYGVAILVSVYWRRNAKPTEEAPMT